MTVRLTTDAARAGVALRRRAETLGPALRRAVRDSGADLLAACRKRSRGALSYPVLRALGHPYARRHGPRGLLDPAVVNAHRGRFLAGWRSLFSESRDGAEAEVRNDSPAAKYMGGTRTMVERPVAREALKDVAPKLGRRLERALDRALGEGGGGGRGSSLAAVSRAAARAASGGFGRTRHL